MKKHLVLLILFFMSSCSINIEKDLATCQEVSDKFYSSLKEENHEIIKGLFSEELISKKSPEELLNYLSSIKVKFGRLIDYKLLDYSPMYSGSDFKSMVLIYKVSYEKIDVIEKFVIKEDKKGSLKIFAYNLASIDGSKK